MGFDTEAKRHFLTAFSNKPGLFCGILYCDGRTRAVGQSYINRSHQIDVNWSRGSYGVSLFGGILYLQQCYDNRELVTRQLNGNREVVVTSVIESSKG